MATPVQPATGVVPDVAGKLAELRAPFPAEYIAYRPQPYCRACSDSRTKVCANHKKVRCPRCKQNMTEAHVDLSYVGHAETTDRLLKSDPAWSWEPLHREIDPHVLAAAAQSGNPDVVRAVIEAAPPKLDQYGGLWIKLTVHGVTRIGYGDAQGKTPGPNAMKEIIGDAIRNASMRFGVGLDLWSKSDMAEVEAAAAAERDGQGRAADQNGHQAAGDGSDHAPDGNGRNSGSGANGHPPLPPPNGDRERQDFFATMKAQINGAVDPAALDNLLAIAAEGCEQHRCPAALPDIRAHIGQRRAALNAPMADRQRARLHAAVGRRPDIVHRDDKLAAVGRIVGRRIDSTSELTVAEAEKAIKAIGTAPANLDLVTGELIPAAVGASSATYIHANDATSGVQA